MPQDSSGWWFSSLLSSKAAAANVDNPDSRGGSSDSTKTPPVELDPLKPANGMTEGDLDLAAVTAAQQLAQQDALLGYLPDAGVQPMAAAADDAVAAAEAAAVAAIATHGSLGRAGSRDSPPMRMALGTDQHGHSGFGDTFATEGAAMHDATQMHTLSIPPAAPERVERQLDVEEFRDGGLTRALIEKQHDVARFLILKGEDIPSSTFTKMAMMKNELDLLSSSITGVLGKSASFSLAPAPAPYHGSSGNYVGSGSQRAYTDQGCWPIVDAVAAPYPSEAELPAPFRTVEVEMATGVLQAYHGLPMVDQDGQPLPAIVHGVHAAPPPAPPPPAPYEDTQGPAVFQGFQPPPSYAWGRMEGGGEGSSSASGAQDAQTAPAETEAAAAASADPDAIHIPPPRPKSISTESPVKASGTTEPPSMRAVLGAAMDELQRCRSTCAFLREERRGVPVEEVEKWCESLGKQLEQVVARLSEKLEAYRKKSQRKDEVIRRLYKQVQDNRSVSEQQMSAASIGGGTTVAPPAQRSPAASKSRRGLLNESPAATRGTTPPANPVASGSPSRRSPGVQGVSASLQGFIQQLLPDANFNIGSEGDAFGFGDAEDGLNDNGALAMLSTTPPVGHPGNLEAAAAQRTRSPSLGPSSTRASPSSRQGAAQAAEDKPSTAAARGRRPLDPGAQKNFRQTPGASSAAQPNLLRREMAHLKRRDVDFAAQIRARDAQVEQLTNTLHQLQNVTQKQIGLYKRQLHMKDATLQAVQEELMQQAPGSVAAVEQRMQAMGMTGGDMDVMSATAPPMSGTLAGLAAIAAGGAGPSAGCPRATGATRRHGSIQMPAGGPTMSTSASNLATGLSGAMGSRSDGVGLAHLAAQEQLRRSSRGGTTPRPSDPERGRTSATATWPGPKKEPRERSQGALPHSPRARHRDVATTSSTTDVGLRRRTSPAGSPAAGRSTSADDTKSRKAAQSRVQWACAKTRQPFASGPVGGGTTRRAPQGSASPDAA